MEIFLRAFNIECEGIGSYFILSDSCNYNTEYLPCVKKFEYSEREELLGDNVDKPRLNSFQRVARKKENGGW